MTPTRWATVETDSPYIWYHRTCLAGIRTDGTTFDKPPTRLAVVKADSPYFCKHATGRWSKRTVRTSTNLLRAARRSKRTLHTSASILQLDGNQSGLSDLRQVSYTLGCGQNGLSVVLLQTPTILYDSQKGLYELLQAPYTLGGGQNGFSELL